jgi:hypothetical protein
MMLHVRLMSESDQCLYDTTFHRFWELHRLKNAQYIVRIEGGLKNNLCFWEAIKPGTHRALQIYLLGFFKACTCGMIGSCDLPTSDDGHKMSAWTSIGDPTRTELHQLF